MEEILRALKALQISDANNVSMPRTGLGTSCLATRSSSESAADEARPGAEEDALENYDWWFCYAPVNGPGLTPFLHFWKN